MNADLPIYQSELRSIIRKLEGSRGRRIARRNALRELDNLLNRIRRETKRAYPSIDKDGKEILPNLLPRGQRNCPSCSAYAPTYGKMAAHIQIKHGGKCWCGYVPKKIVGSKQGEKFKTWAAASERINGLRGHLERVGNLSVHATASAIGVSDKAVAEAWDKVEGKS